ncbi:MULTISPECIES: DUF305 domain-containing protein [unclassified Phenylobacterium]|uniref:DUF305 domain-containing protein n=1 Tax=unclassified Phenylobacterium TaxID=2640670 RepID=UPI00083A0BE9|nr:MULTISPECIES: DUF305 domain-containing protein [unclassified Phenylobacterium]
MKMIVFLAAAAALAAAPALGQPPAKSGAQHKGMDHSGMQHGAMAKQDFMRVMQDMHKTMMSRDDADPDRAFALKMIEHHRMGLAMVEVLEKHGDNAEAKRMAARMADDQRKDIAELQGWLDRNGGRTPKP